VLGAGCWVLGPGPGCWVLGAGQAIRQQKAGILPAVLVLEYV
jgi:hypothetical protein